MEMSESTPSNDVKTWFFNPFHYIAGGRAIGLFAAAVLLGEALSKLLIGALLSAI